MENKEKKSSIGIIIFIIILLLLIGFAVWFFLIKDKDKKEEPTKKEEEIVETKPNKEEVVTKKANEYDYKEGILTRVVDEDGNPLQNEFIIDGIILVGNRHSYLGLEDTYDKISQFVEQGYKKEGINSSFYLNERIEMYLDTKYVGDNENVKVLITPHKTIPEYDKMTVDDLVLLAEEKGGSLEYTAPDFENYNYIGDPYVSLDYDEGKYDILFVYKGKVAYFININLTKEIEE